MEFKIAKLQKKKEERRKKKEERRKKKEKGKRKKENLSRELNIFHLEFHAALAESRGRRTWIFRQCGPCGPC